MIEIEMLKKGQNYYLLGKNERRRRQTTLSSPSCTALGEEDAPTLLSSSLRGATRTA